MRRSNPYRISCSKPNRAALDYSVENSVERAKPFRSKCTSIECACGARSSSREREEDGRGEKDSRREVCGSVARTHRRNRSPSLPLSLPPSMPWTGLLGIPFSSRGIIGRQLATLLRVSRRQEIIL